MLSDTALLAFATCVIAIAVTLGPVQLLVRDGLRRFGGGPSAMRRWQNPVSAGLRAGLIIGVAAAGLLFGGSAAVWAATIALTLLLAGLDLAWRWLPHLWTGCLFALGAVGAVSAGNIWPAVNGVLAGSGLLIILQITFRVLRGKDAIGVGDILLIGAFGTFLGAPKVIFVLGLAAATGLVVESLKRLNPTFSGRHRFGVAYGAHICAAFLLFLIS